MFSSFTVSRAKNGFKLEVEGDEKVDGSEEFKWYSSTYVFEKEAKLMKAIKTLLSEKGE